MAENQDINKLKAIIITGVWSGVYNKHHLPVNLYKATGQHLIKGIKKGYADGHNKEKRKKYQNAAPIETAIKFGTTDKVMLNHLSDNIWFFSAAKTYQQVRGLEATKAALQRASHALVDKNGEKVSKYKAFRDGYYTTAGAFIEGASQIFDTFNDTWLNTEYNTAIAASQVASHWNNIEQNMDVLPYLQFVAIEDEVTCEICGELNGAVRPADDDFWDENMPVCHFNCRCDVIQLDKEEGSGKEWTQEEADDAAKKADDNGRTALFKMNPGKEKIIFQTDGDGKHPYFDIAKGDKRLEDKNFGLPIMSPEYAIKKSVEESSKR